MPEARRPRRVARQRWIMEAADRIPKELSDAPGRLVSEIAACGRVPETLLFPAKSAGLKEIGVA